MGIDKVISMQKLLKLPYGLLDFIRIFTFELIFKIKLKVNAQELDEDQKILFKLLKFYHEENKKAKD